MCVASTTTPMPPRPITLRTTYFPPRLSPGLTLISGASLGMRVPHAITLRVCPETLAAREDLVLQLHYLVVEADDEQARRPLADEIGEVPLSRDHRRRGRDHRAHGQRQVGARG